MFQLFGLDRLKRVLPVGAFGADMLSPGALAVRQIIDPNHSILSTAVLAGLGIGAQVLTGYTVPANSIFELCNASMQWAVGGTVSSENLYVTRGGVNYYISAIVPPTINSIYAITGRIFLIAGDTINIFFNVTAAGVQMSIWVFGVLWPMQY